MLPREAPTDSNSTFISNYLDFEAKCLKFVGTKGVTM